MHTNEPIRVPQRMPPDKDPDGKNYPKLAELARWVIKHDDEVKAARDMVTEIEGELREVEIAHVDAKAKGETAKAAKLEKKGTAIGARLTAAGKAFENATLAALDRRNEMTETRAEARRLQRQLIAKDEQLAVWSKANREKLVDAEKKMGNLDRSKKEICGICRRLARLIDEEPAVLQGEVDAIEAVKTAREGAADRRDGNTVELAGLTVEQADADLKRDVEKLAVVQSGVGEATAQWCELRANIAKTRAELRRGKRLWNARAPAVRAEAKAAQSRLREGLADYERAVQTDRDRLQRLVGVEAEGVRGIDPVAVLEAIGGKVL